MTVYAVKDYVTVSSAASVVAIESLSDWDVPLETEGAYRFVDHEGRTVVRVPMPIEERSEVSLEEAIATASVLDSSEFTELGIFPTVEIPDVSYAPEKYYPKMRALTGVVAYASPDLIAEGSLIYVQNVGVFQVHALKNHSDCVYLYTGVNSEVVSSPVYLLNSEV